MRGMSDLMKCSQDRSELQSNVNQPPATMLTIAVVIIPAVVVVATETTRDLQVAHVVDPAVVVVTEIPVPAMIVRRIAVMMVTEIDTAEMSDDLLTLTTQLMHVAVRQLGITRDGSDQTSMMVLLR